MGPEVLSGNPIIDDPYTLYTFTNVLPAVGAPWSGFMSIVFEAPIQGSFENNRLLIQAIVTSSGFTATFFSEYASIVGSLLSATLTFPIRTDTVNSDISFTLYAYDASLNPVAVLSGNDVSPFNILLDVGPELSWFDPNN
jgi:hypothetical protein